MPHRVVLVQGDIETQEVDVILNSAHTSLLRGSGMCGSIHRAAGLDLEKHCKEIGGCAVGDAVMTPAFELAANHIVHVVSPKIRWGESFGIEHQIAWHSMLDKARKLLLESGYESVAIPAIGMGGHRIPSDFALLSLAEFALDLSANHGFHVKLVSRKQEHVEAWDEIYKDHDYRKAWSEGSGLKEPFQVSSREKS